MLIKAKTLKGYDLHAIDGEIGSVKEFFFDDKFWTVRYLVANTGAWLTNRAVLISPYHIQSIDTDSKQVNINLTKDQIENSPSWEHDKPVSRQYEESFNYYYGVPTYWSGTTVWGAYDFLNRDPQQWKTENKEEKSWDPNLRSTKDVMGHTFRATDGEIGEVDDFIINEDSWTIRYLVLDTAKWFTGRKVLISTQWIDSIDDQDNKVFVNLSRETIKNVPDYDEDSVLTRDYETRLHNHYNRQGYWMSEKNIGAYSH